VSDSDAKAGRDGDTNAPASDQRAIDRAVAERTADLSRRIRLLDVLDRITRITLANAEIEAVLEGVLDEMLEVFGADRAWFVHPCDPEASTWSVPFERTRPGWPGAHAKGAVLPMTPDARATFRQNLAFREPLEFGPSALRECPLSVAGEYSIRSQLQAIVRPRTGPPWLMGIHHCADARFHDGDDLVVFKAIAERLSETLSRLLERKRIDAVHAVLAPGGREASRETFFEVLARFLAESLRMDYVCIDRLEGDGMNARTVAAWCDGAFRDNVTYALKDTPCGELIGKDVCCIPEGVCLRFPRDEFLRDLRAESYLGVTLWDDTGQPIGLIAAIARKPLADRQAAEETLRLVSVRTAGEMERMRGEEAIRERIDELCRWQQVTLGREDRIVELKREVNELLAESGRPPRYASADGAAGPEVSSR
jgi:GAF domain-containing protein